MVLVAITGFYTWRTHVLARHSATAAEAAVRSAESAEVVAQLDSMPVVYAFLGYRSTQPDDDGLWSITWEWRNLSPRPAVALQISFQTQGGEVVTPPFDIDSILAGSSEGMALTLHQKSDFDDLMATPVLTTTVTYQDAFGNTYSTITKQPGGGGTVTGLKMFKHSDGELVPMGGSFRASNVSVERSKYFPPHGPPSQSEDSGTT